MEAPLFYMFEVQHIKCIYELKMQFYLNETSTSKHLTYFNYSKDHFRNYISYLGMYNICTLAKYVYKFI